MLTVPRERLLPVTGRATLLVCEAPLEVLYVNLKLQYIIQVPSLSILFIQLHVVSSFTFGVLFTKVRC